MALRRTPRDFGLMSNVWDGKTLAAFIRQQWDVTLGVRQCQRMLRQEKTRETSIVRETGRQ